MTALGKKAGKLHAPGKRVKEWYAGRHISTEGKIKEKGVGGIFLYSKH